MTSTVGEDRLRATPELVAEFATVSERFEVATPDEILDWSISRFADRLTMGTAFGPEGMSLIARLAKLDRKIHIFNLETGYQFEETLALRAQVKQRYGIAVELMRPELTVEQYEAKHGGPLYKSDPDQCCRDRKTSVLQRAIAGRHAWISGIRRDETPDRQRTPIVGFDKFGLVKICPLANVSKAEVWKFITDHDVPYNPLHDQGYPSIGCWPCTRAVLFGQDQRLGRWNGTEKTECGLHTLE